MVPDTACAPRLDDKILADWNGHDDYGALVKMPAALFGEPSVGETAERAFAFISLGEMNRVATRFGHSWRERELKFLNWRRVRRHDLRGAGAR